MPPRRRSWLSQWLYNEKCMKEIVEQILRDPRYLENIEHGVPRAGHPEGSVRNHIRELEQNLEDLRSRGISEYEYWKLQFLIHVHDSFKKEATPDVRILDPNSHASLAREYASQFTSDADLLNMLQFHDVNYALWLQYHRTGSYDAGRFEQLLETIRDWNLFLMFLIIDGSTRGKDRSKLVWFISEVRNHIETRVDEAWIP
jgi:hypothetical protein